MTLKGRRATIDIQIISAGGGSAFHETAKNAENTKARQHAHLFPRSIFSAIFVVNIALPFLEGTPIFREVIYLKYCIF